MFGFRRELTAEEKLDLIRKILFPDLELRMTEDGTKYHVDYSADSNLEAALMDLEEGYNDRTTQNTIRKVNDKLFEIRRIMEVHFDFDVEAKHYVIETEEDRDIGTSEDY